jgi:endonuclease III
MTHNKCKYFGYKKCPQINDDIMRQATQDIRESYGSKPTAMLFPSNEEIDDVCSKCSMFTQKQDKEIEYGKP